VEHTGTIDRGHYVAFVQAEDQRWYRLDDHNPPREVSFVGEVALANAYLLFFLRLGPSAAPQQATPPQASAPPVGHPGPSVVQRTTTGRTTTMPPPAPRKSPSPSPSPTQSPPASSVVPSSGHQREERIRCLREGQGINWDESELRCVVYNRQVAEGSHRYVVLVDVFPAGETKPTPHVLKITKPVVTARLGIRHDDNAALTELLKAELRMQVEAYRLAERWNALGISPKPIRFNPVYVVQLKRQPPQVGLLEPFLAGAYVKHNDNAGGVFTPVERRERETPQAFSHFTFVATEGRRLVCDIQGVGDVYTDPQIHTYPREAFPVPGNNGLAGMRDFFLTHRCNPLCFAFLKKLDEEKATSPLK
jgi:hypothetical protein